MLILVFGNFVDRCAFIEKIIHYIEYLCSQYNAILTELVNFILISRDGGKWWSKDHHLVVVKIVKNVAFSLKHVKNGERKL